MSSCSCAINEVLIRLMCERIKTECMNMHNGGASVEDINEMLAEYILPHYEAWRREMLERAMAVVESMAPPPDDLSPLTPLRKN